MVLSRNIIINNFVTFNLCSFFNSNRLILVVFLNSIYYRNYFLFVSQTAFKGPYRYCAILLLLGCSMSVSDLLTLFKHTQYTVPTPTFLQGSVHEVFLMCLPHLNDRLSSSCAWPSNSWKLGSIKWTAIELNQIKLSELNNDPKAYNVL